MKINRFLKRDNDVYGFAYIDNAIYFTLESYEHMIPDGTYKLGVVNVGGRDFPHILNVPDNMCIICGSGFSPSYEYTKCGLLIGREIRIKSEYTNNIGEFYMIPEIIVDLIKSKKLKKIKIIESFLKRND